MSRAPSPHTPLLALYMLLPACLLGCINPIPVTDDMYVEGTGGVTPLPPTGSAGAQVSPLAGATVAGSAPPIAGVAISQGPCSPGDRPAPCMICDAVTQTLTTPQRDQSCPGLDCAALSSYRQVGYEDGKVECRRQGFVEAYMSQCQGFGACYSRAEFCRGETEETVIEPFLPNDCVTIEGCVDETAGTLIKRVGEPCDAGQGVCDERGVCVTGAEAGAGAGGVTPGPADLGPGPEPMTRTCDAVFLPAFSQMTSRSYLCPLPNPQDSQLCEIFLDKSTNNNRNYICSEFCQAHGATCVNAWNNANNNSCNHSDSHSCGGNDLESFVCRCRL